MSCPRNSMPFAEGMGFSKSVSRVPGAEPRTSTPAMAPFSASTTVQPVGRLGSVK